MAGLALIKQYIPGEVMPKPFLIQDCPRCHSKRITFDAMERQYVGSGGSDWQMIFEVPAVCRYCERVVVWRIMLADYQAATATNRNEFWTQATNLASVFTIKGYASLKDSTGTPPPEYVPTEIANVFNEASLSHAVDCPNASAAMSRLCLDMVTKNLLPDAEDTSVAQPNSNQRKRLFDRLDWLFEQRRLPDDLKDLADTIRQHGNDGAHDGTCTTIDAEDLLDFTSNVLERVYTQPERVRLARQRALDRRAAS